MSFHFIIYRNCLVICINYVYKWHRWKLYCGLQMKVVVLLCNLCLHLEILMCCYQLVLESISELDDERLHYLHTNGLCSLFHIAQLDVQHFIGKLMIWWTVENVVPYDELLWFQHPWKWDHLDNVPFSFFWKAKSFRLYLCQTYKGINYAWIVDLSYLHFTTLITYLMQIIGLKNLKLWSYLNIACYFFVGNKISCYSLI